MHPIYIGITTTPERLEKRLIHKSIETILKQVDRDELQIDMKIIINIPKTSLKSKTYDYDKAKELQRMSSHIVLQYGVRDYGPITKLIPTLEYIDNIVKRNTNNVNNKRNNDNPLFIIIDDDILFTNNRLQTLLDQIEEKDEAVGFSGRSIPITEMLNLYYTVQNREENVPFLETYAMAAYRRSAFGDLKQFIHWFDRLHPDTIWVDDIVIGAWLDKRGINRVVVPQLKSKFKFNDMGTEKLASTNLTFRNVEMFNWFVDNGYYQDFKIPIVHNVEKVVNPVLKKVFSNEIVNTVINDCANIIDSMNVMKNKK